jgi:spore maturation protein CgeB
LENVHLWTFADVNPFYNRWENVKTLPLAFDSISYKEDLDKKYEFDICYIGGWANNGFGEKRKIMINFFSKISKMDIKCGVFIDKNLTHEQENKILSNTRIPINIHDAYQQKLGYDTNERTFKSLGLNGFLISDKVSQLERIFPLVPTAEDPKQMCEMIEQNLQKDLASIKLQNRRLVRQHHSYIQRVSEMVAW